MRKVGFHRTLTINRIMSLGLVRVGSVPASQSFNQKCCKYGCTGNVYIHSHFICIGGRTDTRLHLLHVANYLFVERIARGDDDSGHFVVNEGYRPMFHLCGGIALRMDVGYFLQFQYS